MTLITDWKPPGTALDLGAIGTVWTNPNNAKVEDGQKASAYIPKMDQTTQLMLYNYGFTTDDLPENATVVGVELAVKHQGGSNNALSDLRVHLKVEETEADPPGDNHASASFWPLGLAWFFYGAMADLWGIPELDGAIVRSEWFGNYIQVQNSSDSTDEFAYLDATKIRVFYTVPEVAVIKGMPLSKRISFPSQGL